MWSTKSIETPLFERAVQGPEKLSSPFAKNFDPSQWISAFAEPDIVERDIHLARSALFFGDQVWRLREGYIKKLFTGISRRSAIILAVGSVNRNYFKVVTDFRAQVKRVGQDVDGIHLSELGQMSVAGIPQTGMSIDDIIHVIVDTLPHWLFEAKNLGDVREPLSTDFGILELRAGMSLSVESGLKELWNTALWEDYRQRQDSEKSLFGPHNKPSAFYWYACQMRTEAAQVGPAVIFHDLAEDDASADVDLLSVTQLRSTKGQLRFGVGAPTKQSRKSFLETMEHLEQSYLADYLDEPICLGNREISLRVLYRALWILSDMIRLMRNQIKPKIIKRYSDAKAFSLGVTKSEVIRVFQAALGTDHERATEIVKQLSIGPDQTGKCFAEGLWIHPLVELSDDELLLVVPSILAGSRIRFGEKSLHELGRQKKMSHHYQGLRFEQRVRDETIAAIAQNNMLTNCVCLPAALKRKGGDGEEIDLILRIGNTVIVGEVKCFVAPSESPERFNYIRNLEHAAVQAARKAAWLKNNLSSVAEDLGIDKVDGQLNFIPLVILNQRMGSGLVIDGSTITDFPLWKLYFSNSQYASGAAIARGQKAVTYTTFYKDGNGAERNLVATFQNPPPLKAFLDGEAWSTIEFPTSMGHMYLERPSIGTGELVTHDLAAATQLLIQARK
jgi:hypothetical protein